METMDTEKGKNSLLEGWSEILKILETTRDGRFCDGKIEFCPLVERKIH